MWEYAGCNSFHKGRMDELRLHPTVKPVQMLVDAMLDCSRRGDIVLDAFAGSGSTILAAERIGRRAYCIELDPLYADVCVRRWQQFTKRDAILEGRGTTYDEIADNVGNEATEPVVVSRQTCTAVVGVELSTSQSPRSRRAGAKNG